MALVNQAEFARLEGVSRKSVTEWKNRNWLVMTGTLVDVEASKKILKKYRPTPNKTVTQSKARPTKKVPPGNTAGNTKKSAAGNKSAAAVRSPDPLSLDPESAEYGAALDIALNGAPHTLDEARRIKENFLAKLREQEFLQKVGELVELSLVEDALFEANRSHRDAWLGFPSKYGPLIAAVLGVEVEPVVEALTKYVHKQVKSLGDAELDLDHRNPDRED